MRELVDPCLYNWLGYGNINSPIWFIGTEEGGAEIWRNKTLSLEQSLKIRASFELSMDQKKVWEEDYQIPLSSFKGPTVWRFIAAFMIALEGKHPGDNRDLVTRFMANELGVLAGNHFLCEFLPLPKKKKKIIEPYQGIWSNINDYYSEVKEKRFQLISLALNDNPKVSLIISYEKGLTELFLKHYSDRILSTQEYAFGKKQKFVLYAIQLNSDRKIQLLKTPFFGQGNISYEGIWQMAQSLSKQAG